MKLVDLVLVLAVVVAGCSKDKSTKSTDDNKPATSTPASAKSDGAEFPPPPNISQTPSDYPAKDAGPCNQSPFRPEGWKPLDGFTTHQMMKTPEDNERRWASMTTKNTRSTLGDDVEKNLTAIGFRVMRVPQPSSGGGEELVALRKGDYLTAQWMEMPGPDGKPAQTILYSYYKFPDEFADAFRVPEGFTLLGTDFQDNDAYLKVGYAVTADAAVADRKQLADMEKEGKKGKALDATVKAGAAIAEAHEKLVAHYLADIKRTELAPKSKGSDRYQLGSDLLVTFEVQFALSRDFKVPKGQKLFTVDFRRASCQ